MKSVGLLLILTSLISCRGQEILGGGDTIEHETCEILLSTFEEEEALWPLKEFLEPKGYKLLPPGKVTNFIGNLRIGHRYMEGGNYQSAERFYYYEFFYLGEKILERRQHVYLKSYDQLERATKTVVEESFEPHEGYGFVVPECIATGETSN